MRAAAQWTAFCFLHASGTVVLHDDSGSFDARLILETAQRERVFQMSIVGDAYARPMIEELRRGDHDLSSLFLLGTGGAVTGDQYKDAFLELLPNVTIVDGYGSSETGGMAYGATDRDGTWPRSWPGRPDSRAASGHAVPSTRTRRRPARGAGSCPRS